MNGLNVTARWVLLQPNPTPIPNPTNPDAHLRPPTEKDGEVNPKYKYNEQFHRNPFEGTTTKMKYIYNTPKQKKKSSGRKKNSRKSLSPTNNARNVKTSQRERGGPYSDFLKKYKLDENSHPIHWLNAILPLTPTDNLEDVSKANVTEDGKTKFSVSMWTAYNNKKALFENAGEPGHIYAGKWKTLQWTKFILSLGST